MSRFTRFISLLGLSALIALSSAVLTPAQAKSSMMGKSKMVHVKAHTRTLKSGKVVKVKAHTMMSHMAAPKGKTVQVKGYTRKTKSGKVVHVKGYTRHVKSKTKM